MSERQITAREISLAMHKKFGDNRRYAVAEEVGLTTGGGCRRLDMVVMDCYFSNNFRIDGFEFKVSTSDLRRELEDPEKHVSFFDVIDFFTLVCPSGIVEPLIEIIPKNWGILIVNEDLTTRYKRRPLALRDEKYDRKVSRGFVASITRSILERQPAKQELEAQFQLGIEEGKRHERERMSYMSRDVTENARRLDEYRKIVDRFELWKAHGDIDKILNDFEAFTKLDPQWIRNDIDGTIRKLEKIRGYLDGKIANSVGQ